MLPIDAAKTRLQTATPGTPRDVGIIRNLQMMYREGESKSCRSYTAAVQQIVHAVYSLVVQYHLNMRLII